MTRTGAQEARAAIERLYITMRHLFIRGSYKPLGVSGESLRKTLLLLRPEIYGLIDSLEKVELDGLLYVMDRLPKGIEECRLVKLISREGFEHSSFEKIVPSKRRRNCYRVDSDQMYVEMTRGRSDIYDILTHLTFLYIESEKIKHNSLDHRNRETQDWLKLKEIVRREESGEDFKQEAAFTYLSNILGRTYEETEEACLKFGNDNGRNSLFKTIYGMGRLAIQEARENLDRVISFSATLRERIGHHVYGDLWASNIKAILLEKNLMARPIHIISANLHSIVNTIYGYQGLGKETTEEIEDLAAKISQNEDDQLAKKIKKYARAHGLIEIEDTSGTNIAVQVIDTALMKGRHLVPGVSLPELPPEQMPVILVMDYAFGEQAFECMDELLKPYGIEGMEYTLNVISVSIMGKAGILCGQKSDIMIPTAHVFEGTADNYPIDNDLDPGDFKGKGLEVFEGAMITVLGTSLQNKDVLRYFSDSSWQAVGLEMEGAHYQKAIQSSSKIRNNINRDVKVRYAYYASDNPLETGSTLASGGLGADGIKPTYLISRKILERMMSSIR